MSYFKVENIKKTIGKNEILKGISFDLEKGQVLVVLGKSGAGKTTLIRTLNFLEFPDEGILELDGKIVYNCDDNKLSNKELLDRHKLMGLVFQGFNLFPHMNVLENVTVAKELEFKKEIKNLKKSSKEEKQLLSEMKATIKQVALNILNELGLSDKINNYPYQLSGGEQQRVAIARALILKPKILCFDEPTSALDPGLTGEVVKVINELKKQKQTMIIITHEMDFAYQVADKIIVMEQGTIIEEKEM